MPGDLTILPEQKAIFRFWETNLSIRNGTHSGDEINGETLWTAQIHYLSRHGKGMEEALQYIFREGPDFTSFINWVEQVPHEGVAISTGQPVLTAADLDFWDANGYLVIKDAVNAEQCAAARTAIWEFLQADPLDKESWYHAHPGKNGLMLNFFQHPALDANRRSAKIRKVFSELYPDTDIYLLVDKVSFNPPEDGIHKFTGSKLHWDVSLHLPVPYVLQGLLYLNDTGPDDGAFHCVPGFHKKIGEWLDSLPEGANPRTAAPEELTPIPVTGRAGDLVIWHQALPHCATPNKGVTPRIVQYITYNPVQTEIAEVWI